jgi:hypothetical protein
MNIRSKAEHQIERVINLTGPEGNALKLIGCARELAHELGWPSDQVDELISEMTAGDDEHIIRVFDENFGGFVTLVR